jgi:hypothetical protein
MKIPFRRTHSHQRSGGRVRLKGAAIAVVLAGGVLLSACGSGTSPTSASTSTSTKSTSSSLSNGSVSSSFTAYRNCLSQHGVTLPAGGGFFGGGGAGSSTASTMSASERTAFTAARKACASLRPAGGFFAGGGGGFANLTPAQKSALTAYRNCLSQHGVALPTPGSASSATPSALASNPQYQAAISACASLRPTGLFGHHSPTSTSTTSTSTS